MSARSTLFIVLSGTLVLSLAAVFSGAAVVQSTGDAAEADAGCSASGCSLHGPSAAGGSASCTTAAKSAVGCTTAAKSAVGCTTSSTSCSVGAGTSRCADYGACSLHADLSTASKETLAMYEREKATDGTRFEDQSVPEFSATSIDGESVDSAELEGRPTLLVFLAAHCGHCSKSLPLLSQLQADYADQDLQVVGVYVNSGSAEQIRRVTLPYAPTFRLWAHPGPEIGEAINSHLVPTYLLVNADGQIQQKLVGFKSQEELRTSLGESLEMRAPNLTVGFAN
jgi:thiol-disulfide isomerase/thioredoxin